jgi:hypothetical protein
MEDVKTWLSSKAADFFDTEIQKLFPDTKSISISAIITLRSSLSMYVFFVYHIFFSLLVLLTAHWTIKTTSFTPPSVIKLYLLFVYAFTSNRYNLITLGRVNEVVLIVLTSVMDQK